MFTAQDITILKTTLKDLFPYGIIDSVDDMPDNVICHKLNRNVMVEFHGVEENVDAISMECHKKVSDNSEWVSEPYGYVTTITEAINAVVDIANTENISAIFYA